MQEQTSWSSTVVLLPLHQYSADTNLCRGFTLVHALSVDEHKHSPTRMRYSKFVLRIVALKSWNQENSGKITGTKRDHPLLTTGNALSEPRRD